jgi:hypothetical protein
MPRHNTKGQDLRLQEIKQYVVEGTYADSVSDNEKRGLRITAKNFTVIGKLA